MAKIGIFDSGVGGISVLSELLKVLPDEEYIYYCDQKNLPYGEKTPGEIRNLTKTSFNFIEKQNVDMVVIACNTATANAERYLKAIFGFPIFGIIDPGISEIVKTTKNKKILVIATDSTVENGTYQFKIKKKLPEAEVLAKGCKNLVRAVEDGHIDDELALQVVEEYLEEFKDFDFDTLVLGCTHFPLARPAIEKVLKKMGKEVNIVDPAKSLAKTVYEFLQDRDFENKKSGLKFYTSHSSKDLSKMVKNILNKDYEEEEINEEDYKD